jgi:hypothetical protein
VSLDVKVQENEVKEKQDNQNRACTSVNIFSWSRMKLVSDVGCCALGATPISQPIKCIFKKKEHATQTYNGYTRLCIIKLHKI